MPWKLIAASFGWCAASSEDGEPPILVVWHPRLHRHFTGIDAWKRAVLFSIRAPGSRTTDSRKEHLP